MLRAFHIKGNNTKAGMRNLVRAISAGVKSEFAPPLRERKKLAQMSRVTVIDK
ncbi:conserved hypothetical protein [Vibrio coralliirubri]|nr:conserved hypothetical protein [Vibrio coralliirubri]CDT31203.1 conserved hypothetical protein [Vibrio coralliirubri]CDT60242.1 conserved hypothetical protein [Vibrio coralliirubri]